MTDEDYDETPAPRQRVFLELAQYGITVEIETPGGYNPDQLDDMTSRAQRLLKAAADEFVGITRDLDPTYEEDEDEEELDDFVEHDGTPPAGDLETTAPNPV